LARRNILGDRLIYREINGVDNTPSLSLYLLHLFLDVNFSSCVEDYPERTKVRL